MATGRERQAAAETTAQPSGVTAAQSQNPTVNAAAKPIPKPARKSTTKPTAKPGRAAAEKAAALAASRKRIDLILEQIDRLPTLSPIATRLLSIASAEDADMEEIAKLIESDPAMSATILGLLKDRADRAVATNITSVRRAILMLGFEAVRSIALSVAVYEVVCDQAEENDRLGRTADKEVPAVDRPGLWKHAVAVACGAELLAERHPSLGISPDVAFVAGLLHDLGRLVLELVLPKATARVLDQAERRGCDSAELERKMIALDHHTAGRRIGVRWGLPDPLLEVMWRHSQPFDAVPDGPHTRLVALVSLAKSYAREQHLGWSGDFGEPPLPSEYTAPLGLVDDACQQMLPDLVRAVADRCEALGLEKETDEGLLLQSIASANRRLALLNQRLRQKAREADAHKPIIEAITRFQEIGPRPARVRDAVERVCTSASDLLGAGYLAVAARPAPDEAWTLYRTNPSGQIVHATVQEQSPYAPKALAIGGAERGTGRPIASLGEDAWIRELLGSLAPPADARLLPLVTGDSPAEPTVLLIHDRSTWPSGMNGGAMTLLLRFWGEPPALKSWKSNN
ncbi:MAG: HDOD domain-containing protein [Planctomycetota bacterium]